MAEVRRIETSPEKGHAFAGCQLLHLPMLMPLRAVCDGPQS
jgi:hypothetical protein